MTGPEKFTRPELSVFPRARISLLRATSSSFTPDTALADCSDRTVADMPSTPR
jgi:hypothetical protein